MMSWAHRCVDNVAILAILAILAWLCCISPVFMKIWWWSSTKSFITFKIFVWWWSELALLQGKMMMTPIIVRNSFNQMKWANWLVVSWCREWHMVNLCSMILISKKVHGCVWQRQWHIAQWAKSGFFVQWVYWVYLFSQNTRPLCNAAMYEQV